jgi:hypothetical protein
MPWTLADLEEFAAAHPGDPFAGRVIDPSAIKIALQHEATGEPPVWSGLGVGEADRWAGVLANIWRRWGISAGETIALFDYGSSPLVLLASSGYVPYLRRGAAERLGIAAVCNDGVATMAARMVTIIETVRPSALVLRRDVLVPLSSALESSGVTLAGRIRWIAVSEPEGVPARSETDRFADIFGVPVYRILRCEAAFLIAGDCAECGLFHLDAHYRAGVVSDAVTITTRFAHLCPAIHYSLASAESVAAGCPVEPRAKRLKWN